MKTFFSSSLPLFILLSSSLAFGAAAPVCPVDGKMAFVPELSDEFEGAALDGAKWLDWNPSFRGRTSLGARVVAPGNGFMYCRDNVSVKDGKLRLTAREMRPDEKTPENLLQGFDAWALSIVKSRAKGCYGYYEIRAKTMDTCFCNAFWLYDPHSDDPDRKFTQGDISEEIDVFEVGGWKGKNLSKWHGPGDLCGTIHAYTTPYLEGIVNRTNRNPPDNGKVRVRLPFRMGDDFHTYGLLWTPEKLTWYVDGVAQDDRHNDYLHRPLHITFDCEMMSARGIPDPKDLPSVYEIDYVRVWKLDPGNTALIARPRIERDGYDWYARHDRILREAKELKPELLFVGDSITHFWNDSPDRTSFGGFATGERWLKAFGRYRALNLGFGWDRTGNVLWRLRYGEVDGIQPWVVVLNIGGNNFTSTGKYKGNTPEEVEAGIVAIVKELHAKFSNAVIVVMGVFPFGKGPNDWNRPKIARLNASLPKALARFPFVRFLDINDKFLDRDGVVRAELFTSPQGVHPNTEGYKVWEAALEPTLKEVLRH